MISVSFDHLLHIFVWYENHLHAHYFIWINRNYILKKTLEKVTCFEIFNCLERFTGISVCYHYITYLSIYLCNNFKLSFFKLIFCDVYSTVWVCFRNYHFINVSIKYTIDYIPGREIMKSSIGSETKKFLAFLSCTKYRSEDYSKEYKSHEDLLRITEGYVALGGGGLALFGTACLHTWAEVFEDIISRFEDTTVVDRSQFLDDSCYR